jgi:hypothetical protein
MAQRLQNGYQGLLLQWITALQSAQKVEASEGARMQIRVAYSNGRWRVIESGVRNAVSCFGERRDAMEYANGLAQRLHTSVQIQ